MASKQGNPLICAACPEAIKGSHYLKCSLCDKAYDLKCASVAEKRFYIMTKEKKDSWTCPECKNKVPKGDNSNTPLRPNKLADVEDQLEDCVNEFVTKRKHNMENKSKSPVDAPSSNIDDNNVSSLVQEMRLFRMDMQGMRDDLQNLRSEIHSLSVSITSCTQRTDELEKKMEDMETRLSSLESARSEISNLERTIIELKTEINDKQQDSMLNDIDLTGIPEQDSENSLHLITLVAAKIGVHLENQDVVWAHRMGVKTNRENNRPRPLVVRFVRRETRDLMLKNARVRKGKITTSQLGVEGQVDRAIYINERLTAPNRHIFRKARELGRQQGWKHIWTRNGRIFTRKSDGTKVYRIIQEDDVQRVFFPTL